MKILLLLAVIYVPGFQDPFEKVDKLADERQYSVAMSLLNEIDPENTNPMAFRRKVLLCVDNYILSIGHKLFALKNLQPGEDINALRGQAGNYDMYSLDVTSIGERLMKEYPEDYKLKFAIGKYYHSMHLNCGDCSLSPTDCIDQFESLYEECYDHDVYDYFSVYGIGYARVNKQNYEESIPFFLKSIELNDDYPSSHYNLAYAYLYVDDRDNCIKYAKQAMDRYAYPPYKADAAKVVATAYGELNDLEKAYAYYAMAYEIYPEDYYSLKPLLSLSIRLKKNGIEALRKDFFELDPDNPTIYQDLIYAYYDYGSIDDLLGFFHSQMEPYKKDPAVLGSLYFFVGKIKLEEGEKDAGKEFLKKARQTLEKVYSEDHQVFPVIDQLLDQG